MIKITVGEDCGNAPKMALLRDFNIAFAQGEIEQLLPELADDIRWNWVGDKVLEGKEHVAEALPQMAQTKVTELTIQSIMTHGKLGAVDGIITFESGNRYAFCDVYKFSSSAKDAKIKEIRSYVIKI